jgi:hypothetical protein
MPVAGFGLPEAAGLRWVTSLLADRYASRACLDLHALSALPALRPIGPKRASPHRLYSVLVSAETLSTCPGPQ